MARVLVIDDDAGLLQMVKLMLEREGHTPILAEGGVAGLQAAQTQAPDLAVIDLMMPNISGYDVTRQLRANPLTTALPILILTARSQPMDKQMALNAGANSFMSKPVVGRELTTRIIEMLTGQAPPIAMMGSVAAAPPPAPLPPVPMPAMPVLPPAPIAPTSGIRRLPIGADALPPLPAIAPPPPAPPVVQVTAQPMTQPISGLFRPPDKQLPVISVLAMGSGVGGTTVAINLAFTFRRMVERVCLIDLNMSGGQIGLQLQLPTRTSWADLLPLGEKLDTRSVGPAITPHRQPGIGLIGSPATPPPQPLSADATVGLLSTLALGFQQIVVDINALNPSTAAALGVARAVVVVISDDNAALQSVGTIQGALQMARVPLPNVRLVINRNRPEMGVSTAAIAGAFGMPVSMELPYDVNQLQAIRRGIPTVVMAPESPFAQKMLQICRTFVVGMA